MVNKRSTGEIYNIDLETYVYFPTDFDEICEWAFMLEPTEAQAKNISFHRLFLFGTEPIHRLFSSN